MSSEHILNVWGDRWFSVISTVVVQSTALAVVIALVAWLLRRSAPAVRYWLWQIVAIRLLVVPFWTVSLPTPWPADPSPEIVAEPAVDLVQREAKADTPGSPNVLPSVAAQAPAAPVTVETISWHSWLLIVWSAVVFGQVARLVAQRLRLSRLLAATTAAPEPVAAACNKIAAQLGITNSPAARVTASECSPFVCGMWRSTLVLPQALLDSLTPAELAPVLAHELAHVKRRDLLWGWTAELARTFYFFHPVAYWAGYHIRLERELACDQLALAHGGQGAGEYAATLVRVLSAASEPNIFRTTVAAGVDGGKSAER